MNATTMYINVSSMDIRVIHLYKDIANGYMNKSHMYTNATKSTYTLQIGKAWYSNGI